MLTDWKFFVLTLLALFALVISVRNHQTQTLIVDKQQSVLERQQLVHESQQLGEFNSQFIQALANLAVQTGDENIERLLADHGIRYEPDSNHSIGEQD